VPPSADRHLLPGRVAVVTGGAAGIGLASAQLFAREGAQVIIADVDAAAGRAAAARIEQAVGSAQFIETDVGSMSAVENLISTTVERYGRLDVIHSNAYHSAVGTATAITEDAAVQEKMDSLFAKLEERGLPVRMEYPRAE